MLEMVGTQEYTVDRADVSARVAKAYGNEAAAEVESRLRDVSFSMRRTGASWSPTGDGHVSQSFPLSLDDFGGVDGCMILGEAFDEGYIAANPCRKLRLTFSDGVECAHSQGSGQRPARALAAVAGGVPDCASRP